MLNDAEKLSNTRTGLANYFITGYSFQLSRLFICEREKRRKGGKKGEKGGRERRQERGRKETIF